MSQCLTLRTNSLPGEIDIHSDLLSILPTALSRKRAFKKYSEKQSEMVDPEGHSVCYLCEPERKPPGSSPRNDVIEGRVADFINDFPYLPGDQRVIFLWHDKYDIRSTKLHKYLLKDFRKMELYWLLRGCIKRGKQYRTSGSASGEPNLLRCAPDLMRMVVGFNLGAMAGQSMPHFHVQYGWEVVLNPRTITPAQLTLYFEELKCVDLVLYQDDNLKVVAPWTPMGKFALDLYFVNKYDIVQLKEDDIKVFAVFGDAIIKRYRMLGIQNLNIIFTNSPYQKWTEPLVAHFIPRTNVAALYEMKGVNVVDTPPSTIAEEFRRKEFNRGKQNVNAHMNWTELSRQARDYNPDQDFKNEMARAAAPVVPPPTPLKKRVTKNKKADTTVPDTPSA